MKSLKSYIPSLILSILLVFSLLASSAMIVAKSYASPEKLIELSRENNISAQIKAELSNYYSDKYNVTGIPAEVYTSVISDEYIEKMVEININAGFSRLSGKEFDNTSGRDNPELEKSITDFFNNYADDNGYVKDEKFDTKLATTINSAYSHITDSCDIYKLSTMNNEGILIKASPVYLNLDKLMMIVFVVTALLIAAVLLVNIKAVAASMYWCGITAVVAGVIGVIPSVYLSSTNYFDAFVIKQPQIFTSFTTLMYKAVDHFSTTQIILIVVGAALVTLFVVFPSKAKITE